MVNYTSKQMDVLFSALSDSTRRQMLRRLVVGEMPVAELAEPFDLSKPAITKHLKTLEKAGLLSRRVEGRVHWCRIEGEPLNVVSEWVSFYEKFWNQKFDELEAFLEVDMRNHAEKHGEGK